MTVWRFGPWTPQLKSAAFRVSQTYCWPQSSTRLAQTPHHSRTPRLQRRPLKAAPSSSKHFLPKPSWGRLEAKYLDWMGGRGHPSEGYFTQAMGREAACCAGMLGPTVLENHRILFSQLDDASCTLRGGSTPTMCSELSRWPLSSPFTLLLTWRTYQVEWLSLCIGRHGSASIQLHHHPKGGVTCSEPHAKKDSRLDSNSGLYRHVPVLPWQSWISG